MSTPALQTGHIGLNVTDLARSTAFYRRVFGFEVLGEQTDGDRSFAFLGHDGALQVTLWQQSSGTFPTGRPGLHHLSFQAPDIETVHRAEATLRESTAAGWTQFQLTAVDEGGDIDVLPIVLQGLRRREFSLTPQPH